MSEIILTMNHTELFMVASYCCIQQHTGLCNHSSIIISLSHNIYAFISNLQTCIHPFLPRIYSSWIDKTSSISIYSLIKSHFHLNQSFPEFLPQFNLFFEALISFGIHITFVQPKPDTCGLFGSIWAQQYVIIATIMPMFTQFITQCDPVMIEWCSENNIEVETLSQNWK